MKKFLTCLMLMVSVGLFSSCGHLHDTLENSPILREEESDPLEESIDSADIPIKIIVEDDTLPPQAGMVRSKLTNEWITEKVSKIRPIAVMIPNESAAIPHYNLSEASVVYEANVEGHMTRMMAVYEDWQKLDKIGNVRSLRSYFAYWAFEWDAFIVHFGGPFFINDLLAEPTTQTINGSVSESPAFIRSTDRSAPHNAYATGSGLYNAITNMQYSLAYRGLSEENHFLFTSKAKPNTLEQFADAQNATYIDLTGCYPLTRCYFEFNEEDGLYYRFQHLSGDVDGPHIDAATDKQLSFKNIIVQNIKYENLGEGYLAFQCHDTTKDGWYFTNGKGIHITWEKTSDYGATKYYDDTGAEITLNTGKTMICIVQDGTVFSYR